MMNKLFWAIFVVSIVTVVGAGAASAETVSTTVSYAGLDLLTPAGQAQFDKRIVTAANEICGSPYSHDLLEQRLFRNCRTGAIDNGRAQAKVAIAAANRNTTTQMASAR